MSGACASYCAGKWRDKLVRPVRSANVFAFPHHRTGSRPSRPHHEAHIPAQIWLGQVLRWATRVNEMSEIPELTLPPAGAQRRIEKMSS
jgi:hypothetical protein